MIDSFITTMIVILLVICKNFITVIESHCRQPVNSERCKTSEIKWFYNVVLKECHPFLYGGCKRNGHSFATEEQCRRMCKSNVYFTNYYSHDYDGVADMDTTTEPPPHSGGRKSTQPKKHDEKTDRLYIINNFINCREAYFNRKFQDFKLPRVSYLQSLGFRPNIRFGDKFGTNAYFGYRPVSGYNALSRFGHHIGINPNYAFLNNSNVRYGQNINTYPYIGVVPERSSSLKLTFPPFIQTQNPKLSLTPSPNAPTTKPHTSLSPNYVQPTATGNNYITNLFNC